MIMKKRSGVASPTAYDKMCHFRLNKSNLVFRLMYFKNEQTTEIFVLMNQVVDVFKI